MKNLLDWSAWLGAGLAAGAIIGKWPEIKHWWRGRNDGWFFGGPHTIKSYPGPLPPVKSTSRR